MDAVFQVQWDKLFGIDTPLLEIFVRGSVMYLGLFALMRFVLRREAGALSINDVLVIVLLADAAQNGMAGDYMSITDGLLLVTTIIGWSYALDWLGFHFPAFQRLIEPPPLALIRDGKILWRNLRKEMITEEELRSHLRQQGVSNPEEVSLSYMEPDGSISVVTNNGQAHAKAERKSV